MKTVWQSLGFGVVALLGVIGFAVLKRDVAKAPVQQGATLTPSPSPAGITWDYDAALKAQAVSIGRYQVVNPTPAMTRNTMLLDTVTGQTWVYCDGTDGNSVGWCGMVRAAPWEKTPR